MWHSASDGTTSRILVSDRVPGGGWERLGTAIEPGLSGPTDSFAAESPCVVKTPGGYLMVYGLRFEVTRLHVATSTDARDWISRGILLQRGPDDASAATDPCIVITGERWWLFYTGTGDSKMGRHAAVLAAVSDTGASWDRMGPILEPDAGEISVSHACVVDFGRTFWMFYASEDPGRGEDRIGDIAGRDVVGATRNGHRARRRRARHPERPHSVRREPAGWVASDMVRRPPSG